ncbi:hypothetical protein GmHk_12G034481 [Glycine max]|nr:hypothetical protein GmHk_12G034481 [Glycine max]
MLLTATVITNEGGLGIREISKFNVALLGKWIWALASGQQHLWARIINSKYGVWTRVKGIYLLVEGLEEALSSEMWLSKKCGYVFTWRLLKDRLPTKGNLLRRNVAIQEAVCPLCGQVQEEVGHLLFNCKRKIGLWWESMRWIQAVGPLPASPASHFAQFCDGFGAAINDSSWCGWWHRNLLIFQGNPFDSSKVMEEAICQINLERNYSDDSPIILKSKIIDWGPKPFNVFDVWLKMKHYQQVVKDCWSAYQPMGWGGFALKNKLKNLKHRLKRWSKENSTDIYTQIKHLQQNMNELENSMSSQPSEQQIKQLKELQSKLWEKANLHECILRQKARKGDNNSSYFHKLINYSRRRNAIRGLLIDGSWVEDPLLVKAEVLQHFQNRFHEPQLQRPNLDGVHFSVLSAFQKDSMVEPFKEEEITCADLRAIFQQQHSNSLINNMRWKVGDGVRIRFWKDKWREGDLTLQDKYPALYQVSTQQNHSINSMGLLVDNRWEWKFQWRRNLFDHQIGTATAFMADIEDVHIQPSSRDLLLWSADSGGSYTTKSAYNLLKAEDRHASKDGASKIIWSLKIPPRPTAFSWRIFKNKLPTKDNLRRRHVELPSYNCPLYDTKEEIVGHVICIHV